jgi:isopenicillin N synthase-like dioxygenase
MRWIFSILVGFFSILSAEETLDLRIPVVDMRDYADPEKQTQFLDTLYGAMTQVGFFAVLHAGVDASVIKNAYDQAAQFFKQDLNAKLHCYEKSLGGQRGFVQGETAKGASSKDVKEFYHIGKEGLLPENIWPKDPAFKQALNTLYQELEQYVVPLQEAIVATINARIPTPLPLDFLNATTKEGKSLLRALYYPAFSKEQLDNPTAPLYWGAPHTDIDFLAILPYATEKGLQVELNGEWLNVVVPEDAFIVNVGDMLENLTNGLFVSARHRIVATAPDKDRFSMVLFVHPTDDTPLDPLPACIELTGGQQRYAPGTRKEFLWERLLELNIAPGLLVPYSQTGHTERQLQYNRASPQVVEMLIKAGLASPALTDQ